MKRNNQKIAIAKTGSLMTLYSLEPQIVGVMLQGYRERATCWSTPTASSPVYMMFTQPSLDASTNNDIRACTTDRR